MKEWRIIMTTRKKKRKIRWDRVGILIVSLILIIGSPFWLYKMFLIQTSMSAPRVEQEQSEVKIERGSDGVYRIDGTIIVNKKYGLPQAYNPGVNQEAKNQVKTMIADMQRNNLNVSSEYVGYRSFEDQNNLYEQYKAENGKDQADRFSARPGFSEHQTGLAFDIVDKSGELLMEKNQPEAVKWLANNAHNYGFIIRYMEDKEAITGYMHEEWHVRYLGKDLATKVYDSKKSLEEYFNIKGGGYE